MRFCYPHCSFIVILLTCLAAGCDSNPNGQSVYPVCGRVSYDGKPTPGAKIYLYPVDATTNSVIPHAVVDSDGTFRFSTYGRDDGAPAGRYNATVIWTKAASSDDEGETLIPMRYGNPKTSNLAVEIKEQPNELSPFQLTR
jgi:hypothetical protein